MRSYIVLVWSVRANNRALLLTAVDLAFTSTVWTIISGCRKLSIALRIIYFSSIYNCAAHLEIFLCRYIPYLARSRLCFAPPCMPCFCCNDWRLMFRKGHGVTYSFKCIAQTWPAPPFRILAVQVESLYNRRLFLPLCLCVSCGDSPGRFRVRLKKRWSW